MRRPTRLFVNFFRAVWETVTDPQFLELMIIAAGTLLTGTFYYHLAEGWSFVDAFYFCVTTLSTVGYGDMSPTTDASKLFTAFYIMIGVGIMLGFVNAIATHTKDKSPLNKLFEKR